MENSHEKGRAEKSPPPRIRRLEKPGAKRWFGRDLRGVIFAAHIKSCAVCTPSLVVHGFDQLLCVAFSPTIQGLDSFFPPGYPCLGRLHTSTTRRGVPSPCALWCYRAFCPRPITCAEKATTALRDS